LAKAGAGYGSRRRAALEFNVRQAHRKISMLWIVGKQPAFEALVHHRGRNCKMERGRTAISERFRIQLPFNGCCVIDDLQARAGGEPADIAWMLWRWRMMQKFRGICFYDSVNIMDTQLALIGKQPIGRSEEHTSELQSRFD